MSEQDGLKKPPGNTQISPGQPIERGWLEWLDSVRIWNRRVNVIREDNTANPPTDAQLTTAFGEPEAVGDGFVGLLDDNGAGTALYLCVARGSSWFYATLTAAL